jgi:hypothetical protein
LARTFNMAILEPLMAAILGRFKFKVHHINK